MKKLFNYTALRLFFAGIGAGYFISTNAGTVTENTDSEEAASASTATVFKEMTRIQANRFHRLILIFFSSILWPFRHRRRPLLPIPAQIAPQEDFSPEAQAVIDHDGYLNVLNNSVVEYVETTKIKTKYFTVTIPGCWVGNIVIQRRYINDTASESSDTWEQICQRHHDTDFYEKSNFKNIRLQIEKQPD